MPLPKILQQRFDSSLQACQNLHSTNIVQSYLSIFVRAAGQDFETVRPVVLVLLKNMSANSSNDLSSLYAIAKLADVSPQARSVVDEILEPGFLEEYEADADPRVANNTRILRAVIEGVPLSSFESAESNEAAPQQINNFFPNASQVAINSPGAAQHLEITNTDGLDADTRQLVMELKEALGRRDSSRAKILLGFLADKGTDVLVQLLTGAFFLHSK
ncbi:MAG TPA: hypothetical protein VIM53_02385 [Candidatus Saccharimonadales bacterium]